MRLEFQVEGRARKQGPEPGRSVAGRPGQLEPRSRGRGGRSSDGRHTRGIRATERRKGLGGP